MADRRPLVRFQSLGIVKLTDADGRQIGSILARPKDTAVLAYLALATPRGFQRRDMLHALLWPELGADRARVALNKGVHQLRRALGAAAVLSHGEGDVGLAWDLCWCDSAAFEEALDRGQLEAAADLYGGDLLPGLYVSEAPDFERWLERERGRLREGAREAIWTLTERAEVVGDVRAAAHWARRALHVAPYDERALRALVSLLDRAGERAGALGEYEDFTRRLQVELDLEPSPETRALAEEVRARTAARVGLTPPVDTPAPPIGFSRDEATAPLPYGPDGLSRPGHPATLLGSPAAWWPPFRRRRLGLGLGTAALVTAILGIRAAGPGAPTPAPARPGVLAVKPFEFSGDSASAYLGEAASRLIAANLGPSGADATVAGEVVEAGGRVRIVASLEQRRGEARKPVRAAVEGEPEELFELADELSARLLAAHGVGPAARRFRSAERLTHSLPALRAFLEGEAALRGGRYAAALDAFKRAVDADRTFALAYWRLGVAAEWVGGPDALLHWAVDEAVRGSDRLSPRDRLHVRAFRFYVRSEPGLAEPLYRTLVAEDSLDAEAWEYLADVQFHWGAERGRAVAESRPAWERVLALDPGNISALLHLVRITAAEGRRQQFEQLASRIGRLEPDEDRMLELRAIRAFAFGSDDERRAAAMELRRLGPGQVRPTILRIAEASPDLAGVAEHAQTLFLHTWRMAGGPRSAHDFVWLAHVEAARGRLRAAGLLLDSAAALDGPVALEYRAALSTFPLAPARAQRLDRLRSSVAAAAAAPSTDGLRPARRAYVQGVLSARLHQASATAAQVRSLERLRARATADSARESAGGLAALLRAEVARAQGRHHEALAALGEPPLFQARVTPTPFLHYPKAEERWLRAELLRELGNDEDALRWYATFPDNAGYELTYLAPSHLRRAEIYARTGRFEQAAFHYARFIGLWRHADPELQPTVRQAQRALARLGRN